MASRFSFGRHTANVDVDGILFIKYHGAISLEDMKELSSIVEVVAKTTSPVFLLSDLSGAGPMSSEARRFTGQWLASSPVIGGANFGAATFARAAGELVASLLRLIHVTKVPFTFVKSEAEARNWIASQRAAPRSS
jgi:hypothetical protein